MSPLTTITRSFAYKHNAGNYESRDFFCSRSQECTVDQADEVSEQLFQWCKTQVRRDLVAFLEQVKTGRTA
jgi:hypothetical protein